MRIVSIVEVQAIASLALQPLVAWFFPNESQTKEIVSLSVDEEFQIALTYASTAAR